MLWTLHGLTVYSWNSTGKIGRIGRHLAEKPDVKVTMYFGPMPPDASDFPGGIPAIYGIVEMCETDILLESELIKKGHWKTE